MNIKYKRPIDSYYDNQYFHIVGNTIFEILTVEKYTEEKVESIAKSAYKNVANKDETGRVIIDLRP